MCIGIAIFDNDHAVTSTGIDFALNTPTSVLFRRLDFPMPVEKLIKLRSREP